jgi:hypothetical protein
MANPVGYCGVLYACRLPWHHNDVAVLFFLVQGNLWLGVCLASVLLSCSLYCLAEHDTFRVVQALMFSSLVQQRSA